MDLRMAQCQDNREPGSKAQGHDMCPWSFRDTTWNTIVSLNQGHNLVSESCSFVAQIVQETSGKLKVIAHNLIYQTC